MGATYEVNISGEITYQKSLTGSLSTDYIDGSIVPIKVISGEVVIPEFVDYETFDGDYEYTPMWAVQDIPTENKLLTSDILINSIPLYEVSNEFGGITLSI